MEEPIEYFHHHICHTCKLKSSTIKTCSGCRLISYCSQMHQKEDWKHHKSLCLCVRNFLKKHNLTCLFILPCRNTQQWRRKILRIISDIEFELKRHLTNFETEMFFFPDICPVCFVANFDKNLNCEHCYCVRYCSVEHKNLHFNKHKTDCLPFKICHEIDRICFKSEDIIPNIDVPQCNGFIFPASMEEFLKDNFTNHSDFLKVIWSEHFSGSLNMLFAINLSKSIISGKNEIDIHIIGANNYEQSVIMTIELLFHWFSHLEKINLTFIGPEVFENYIEPVLCTECNNTKKLNVYKEKKFYHQYTKHGDFKAPDVIFSYNCGFSEVMNPDKNTWLESIKEIWNMKQVLFAFTSYTESEAKADFSLVLNKKPETKVGVEILMASCQNPFKSLRPFRNWERFESTFFYNNNFIGIIKIKEY